MAVHPNNGPNNGPDGAKCGCFPNQSVILVPQPRQTPQEVTIFGRKVRNIRTEGVCHTVVPLISFTPSNLNNSLLECNQNVSSPKLIISTTNYTLYQPLGDHVRAKCILMNPLRDSEPFIIQHILKNNPKKKMHQWDVCKLAEKIYREPNAGGKSINSEAFSVNVLDQLYGITDIISEMEVQYVWYNYKKCDYVCTLFGQRVGVSVTRAMGYPNHTYFTSEDAQRLLKKKISGLLVARDGVINKYNFDKCILHMWCESLEIADIIKQEHENLDECVKDDIIIVLTVTKPYTSPFIYYDKDFDIIQQRVLSE